MSCIILAGGQSSRLGFDKAGLVIENELLLSIVISRLDPVFERFIYVSNSENPPAISEKLTVVGDEIPGLGPLGGIQAGLRTSKTDWSLVIGCDMPFVTVDFVRFLTSETSDEIDAVIPLSKTGTEPLLALYSNRCLSVIDELLALNKRKITDLLDNIRTRYLVVSESRKKDQPSVFFNINTPEDLEKATIALRGKK